jgi:hypothetical protein
VELWEVLEMLVVHLSKEWLGFSSIVWWIRQIVSNSSATITVILMSQSGMDDVSGSFYLMAVVAMRPNDDAH